MLGLLGNGKGNVTPHIVLAGGLAGLALNAVAKSYQWVNMSIPIPQRERMSVVDGRYRLFGTHVGPMGASTSGRRRKGNSLG